MPQPLVVDACALICNPGAETESERERDPVLYPRYPKVNCKLQSDSQEHQAWVIASNCLKLCNRKVSLNMEVNCFALRSSLGANLGCYCEALTPLSPNTINLSEDWKLNFLVKELANDIITTIANSSLDMLIICEIHRELFNETTLKSAGKLAICYPDNTTSVLDILERTGRSERAKRDVESAKQQQSQDEKPSLDETVLNKEKLDQNEKREEEEKKEEKEDNEIPADQAEEDKTSNFAGGRFDGSNLDRLCEKFQSGEDQTEDETSVKWKNDGLREVCKRIQLLADQPEDETPVFVKNEDKTPVKMQKTETSPFCSVEEDNRRPRCTVEEDNRRPRCVNDAPKEKAPLEQCNSCWCKCNPESGQCRFCVPQS